MEEDRKLDMTIRIPKDVDAPFRIFGLGWRELLIMLGIIGFAVFLVYLNRGDAGRVFKILFLDMFVVGVPYAFLAQTKHRQTAIQKLSRIVKNRFLRPQRWKWRAEDGFSAERFTVFEPEKTNDEDQEQKAANDERSRADLLN